MRPYGPVGMRSYAPGRTCRFVSTAEHCQREVHRDVNAAQNVLKQVVARPWSGCATLPVDNGSSGDGGKSVVAIFAGMALNITILRRWETIASVRATDRD